MTGPVQQVSLEKVYADNQDISPAEIKKLREWLDTQPHMPGKYLTELDLILVYHCCKHSIEVAKQVLDLHYTLRTLFTTFFKDRCFDKKIEFTLNSVLFAPLSTPSINGFKVIYMRLLDFDPRNFWFNDCIRIFMMMFDMLQYVEGVWPGLVVVIDMDRAVMGHVSKLEVMTIKKVLYFVQECMLVKLREVHLINAPSFVDKLMMLLKPFLNKALMDIIHIHPIGTDTVHNYVTKDSFPKDDGGKYKDHNSIRDETIQLFQANTKFFREEEQKRVNENLRQGKKSNVHDMFGIQGSFKKLDID